MVTDNKEDLEVLNVNALNGEIIPAGEKAFTPQILQQRSSLQTSNKQKEECKRKAIIKNHQNLLQEQLDPTSTEHHDTVDEPDMIENYDVHSKQNETITPGSEAGVLCQKCRGPVGNVPALPFHFPTGKVFTQN